MTLLEELKRAEKGSRELDCEIYFLTVRPEMAPDIRKFAARVGCSLDIAISRCKGPIIAHYTTSLDAARTLVPDGLEISLTDIYGVPMAEVGLNHQDGSEICRLPHGTLELALCGAALKMIEREKAKDSVTSS